MQHPEWVRTVLESFGKRAEPFMETSLADALGSARRGQGDLPDDEWRVFLAEWAAFMFMGRPDEDSMWGTYFAPMMEFAGGEGKRIVRPDVAELDAGTVAHWEERVANTQNPTMKARYADCIWDLEQTITRGKRRVAFAVNAIEAYIEVMERDGFAGDVREVSPLTPALSIEGVQMAARALHLALKINKPDLARRAAAALISFCDRHRDAHHAGIWLAPFDILYDQKRLLTAEQEQKIVADLEEMLARTSLPGKDFDPFNAQAAAERLARHHNNPSDTKRLVLAYGSAFEFISKEAAPMLALAWLQPVIESYEQAGMKADAERVALFASEKGKGIPGDLKTYSVDVQIDRTQMDTAIDTLLSGIDLERKLLQIARGFVPSERQAKEALEFARTNAPLTTLFQQHIVTSDGFTTAKVGSAEDDPEGRLVSMTARNIGMMQPFLSYCLSELKRRSSLSAEDLVSAFEACPLFSDRRRKLLTEGIRAYLTEDWIKAVHVLVPQIEEALRNLLSGIGVPVYKTGRNGTMDQKNLGEVLSDLRIREVLGDDVWRYLCAVFIDRRAINLRNNVAHGLLDDDAFGQPFADLVFHALLVISGFRKREANTEGQEHP